MKNFSRQAAQGDVLIRRVDAMPDDVIPVPRDNNRVILAYGEVTGHAHAIAERDVEMFVAPNRSPEDEMLNVRFMRVMAGATIAHEEHGAILPAPGLYEVRQQRIWTDAEEPLRVAD